MAKATKVAAPAAKKAPVKKAAAAPAPVVKAATKKAAPKKAAPVAPKAAPKKAVKAAPKKAVKAAPKKAAKAAKPAKGFMAALTLSPALAAVIGKKPLPRTEIIKEIWVYIKKNGLQDAANKRMINADDKLKVLFEKPQVSMFDLAKIIGKHVS